MNLMAESESVIRWSVVTANAEDRCAVCRAANNAQMVRSSAQVDLVSQQKVEKLIWMSAVAIPQLVPIRCSAPPSVAT